MRGVGLLKEGGVGGQFLGRKEGRGLQRERSGGRKEGGLSLVGQSHTHTVIVFGSRGLLGGVRMKRRPG